MRGKVVHVGLEACFWWEWACTYPTATPEKCPSSNRMHTGMLKKKKKRNCWKPVRRRTQAVFTKLRVWVRSWTNKPNTQTPKASAKASLAVPFSSAPSTTRSLAKSSPLQDLRLQKMDKRSKAHEILADDCIIKGGELKRYCTSDLLAAFTSKL